MMTVIYKDGKEVCRIEYSGRNIIYILGPEEQKFRDLMSKQPREKFIWEILADEILGDGYSLKTHHSNELI